jgi:hypothetical protein
MVHKPGNKMRPISSNNNATTEKIAKWLSNEFKNVPDPPGQWVKKKFEFVESCYVGERRTTSFLRCDSTVPECALPTSYETLKRFMVKIHRAGTVAIYHVHECTMSLHQVHM